MPKLARPIWAVTNHRSVLIITGLVALFCATATRVAGTVRGASPASAEVSAFTTSACPLQTPEEWQRFLTMAAANEKWAATCEDSTCDQQFYQAVKENVQGAFDACAAFIAEHPGIARCTKNMRDFTPAWMRQHDGDSYGFMIDNRAYLKAQEAADKPQGMMQPPPALIKAFPNRKAVEEAAQKNGWKYLTHDSGLTGTRTFIVLSDPQGRFDQWMLLNLQEGSGAIRRNMPFSFIAVQKKDSFGRVLPKIRAHFRDYAIEETPAGFHLGLNEGGNGKCYSCHTNGMRQLIPRWTPILDAQPVKFDPGYEEGKVRPPSHQPSEFAYRRLIEFNKLIRSYGAADWQGQVVPENHGPMLGRAQGCVDCHDGESRAALNISTSVSQLEQKVVKELGMSPDTQLVRWLERAQMRNPELSEDETHALNTARVVHQGMLTDFLESRFPELRQWFLEVPCR